VEYLLPVGHVATVNLVQPLPFLQLTSQERPEYQKWMALFRAAVVVIAWLEQVGGLRTVIGKGWMRSH